MANYEICLEKSYRKARKKKEEKNNKVPCY